MNFLLKVIRNAGILGFGWIISNLASFDDFSRDEFVPLIIFVGLYIFAELTHHYHISSMASPRRKINTLIF